LGDPDAQYYLSTILFVRLRRFEEGARWLERMVQQGDTRAYNLLGGAHLKGLGVPKDPVRGLQLYEIAIARENTQAMCNLAKYYHAGEGVPRDDARAFELWQRGATRGDIDCQLRLGIAFFNGIGTSANKEEGMRWFRIAADKRQAAAQGNLGWFYATGDGIPKNPERGCFWLMLAENHAYEDAKSDHIEERPYVREFLRDTSARRSMACNEIPSERLEPLREEARRWKPIDDTHYEIHIKPLEVLKEKWRKIEGGGAN
jgi:TPR repeat protein